jgi:hypothetical protein
MQMNKIHDVNSKYDANMLHDHLINYGVHVCDSDISITRRIPRALQLEFL